nr:isoform 2 of zinc finger protein 793 [Quercus suber]
MPSCCLFQPRILLCAPCASGFQPVYTYIAAFSCYALHSESKAHTTMAHSRDTAKSSAGGQPEEQRYVCEDCGRSYKAIETLNRHRKNHSDAVFYACTSCTATFKRKDLLDRHSNIHVSSGSSTQRHRSQRACERCSRLKTRCDALMPCTRCARNNHPCTYRDDSSRSSSLRPVETTVEESGTSSVTGSSVTGSVADSISTTSFSPPSQLLRPAMQGIMTNRVQDWQSSIGLDPTWSTDASWTDDTPPSWPLESGPYLRQPLGMEHHQTFAGTGLTTNQYPTTRVPVGMQNTAHLAAQNMQNHPSFRPTYTFDQGIVPGAQGWNVATTAQHQVRPPAQRTMQPSGAQYQWRPIDRERFEDSTLEK